MAQSTESLVTGGTEVPSDIDVHTTAGKLADLKRRVAEVANLITFYRPETVQWCFEQMETRYTVDDRTVVLRRVPDGVVCVLDADGSFDPAHLPLVADPVRAGTADLAVALGRAAVVERPGAWAAADAWSASDFAVTTIG